MPLQNTISSQKTCTKCGETKPATSAYFHRTKKSKSGLREICKVCRAQYAIANSEHIAEYKRAYQIANKEELAHKKREYAAAHPERVKELDRLRWARADKEREREKGRAYRQANRKRLQQQKREYYRANREAHRERERAWKAANKERWGEYYRAWYEENRERIIQQTREYRKSHYADPDNAERKKQSARKWDAANPLSLRAKSHRRRARMTNAEGTHTAADIKDQYKRQKGKCFWCGVKVGDTYHVDHVTPISRGGSNDPSNLVISCPPCNHSRNNRLPSEWPQGGRLL
jgi:5-methylcytosine-specific restriction endonuclease McrA